MTVHDSKARATCSDCGVSFPKHGPAKRCKPCAYDHMEREQMRRNRERAQRKAAQARA